MSSSGYIRLSRKFFDNPYWKQKRTFSFSEAWLDLIRSARFEEKPSVVLLANGKEITLQRGEIHASLRYLSTRWGWGTDKTKKFIDKHIEKQEIERKTEQGESILKLCNYERYNPLPNTDPYSDQYSDPYTDRTPTRTNTNKEKKDKERKEEYTPLIVPPKGDKDSPKKKKREKFSQPSIVDIQTYCEERGNSVDAERFINHYTSNGWKVGKNPMKDWKAAVRTWEKNDYGKGKLSTGITTTQGDGSNSCRSDAERRKAERDDLKRIAGAILRQS